MVKYGQNKSFYVVKYGQNNERQSLFDKRFMNREKWGLTPNKRVAEQEVVSVKY